PATELKKDDGFPILICPRVVADGQELEMPLVTFMMAGRLRLSRALGVDVREAGLTWFNRLQNRIPPVVISRAEAPVKQVVETGADVDVRRFPAPRHHRMDPGRYVTEGLFLTFNRTSRRDNSSMQRGWL